MFDSVMIGINGEQGGRDAIALARQLASDDATFYSGSVDLLVTGSRGYGPVGRLMHGSTSAHLTRASRCPPVVQTRSGGIESEPDRAGSDEVAAKV
jgi:hypothetical protein